MRFAIVAWLGSLMLMAGALFFQYGMDMRPCQLCYYQRVPHWIAIVFGAYGIWAHKKWVYGLLALLILMGAAVAFYHVGVEQHWWQGPTSCTGASNLSVDELLATPPARCDEIPWSFLGISMAGWNAVISLGISVLWIIAARRK